MLNDTSYMERALALARRGGAAVRPNPLVGAVVVNGGKIVGRGWHRAYGGPHAEVEALKDAGANAKGGTLYVTLEPCNHRGKTPPCTDAVLKSGVTRVVVAMDDPNPHVAGGGNETLRKRGLSVETGCLRERALELNASWVRKVTAAKPMFYGLCVLTLNGAPASAAAIEDEPRIARYLGLFDKTQMVLVRERDAVADHIKKGELSRLVVIHAPEFAPHPAREAFFSLPLTGLVLLRTRRLGRFAVSTYDVA